MMMKTPEQSRRPMAIFRPTGSLTFHKRGTGMLKMAISVLSHRVVSAKGRIPEGVGCNLHNIQNNQG